MKTAKPPARLFSVYDTDGKAGELLSQPEDRIEALQDTLHVTIPSSFQTTIGGSLRDRRAQESEPAEDAREIVVPA